MITKHVDEEWSPFFDSPCLVTNAKDGRYSFKQKKICFAYHLTAFMEHGRDILSKVATSKMANDITISHLCNNHNCVQRGHHILESKKVNEERIHCHYVLTNIALNCGIGVASRFRATHDGWCPHVPECGERRDSCMVMKNNAWSDMTISPSVAHLFIQENEDEWEEIEEEHYDMEIDVNK